VTVELKPDWAVPFQAGWFQPKACQHNIWLGLGWTSTLITGAMGVYSRKISFEKSKLSVAPGVLLYVLLHRQH
jgi:hypothetical protein